MLTVVNKTTKGESYILSSNIDKMFSFLCLTMFYIAGDDMTQETLQYDDQIRQTHPVLVGCDEVGRGCLAGPIVTAAVVDRKSVV